MRSPQLFSRSSTDPQDIDRKFREVSRLIEMQARQDVTCGDEKRLIVRSADGHYWQIQVDNTGLLATTDLGTDFPS